MFYHPEFSHFSPGVFLYTCLICKKNERELQLRSDLPALEAMQEHLLTHGISQADLDAAQKHVLAPPLSEMPIEWHLPPSRSTELGLVDERYLRADPLQGAHFYCLASVFPDEMRASRASDGVRNVLYLHEQDRRLFPCRLRDEEAWYVLVLGDEPVSEVLHQQLVRILSMGIRVVPPTSLLRQLFLRGTLSLQDRSSWRAREEEDVAENALEGTPLYRLIVRYPGDVLTKDTKAALGQVLQRRAVAEIQEEGAELIAHYASEEEGNWTFGEVRQHFPKVPVISGYGSVPSLVVPPPQCSCYLVMISGASPYYGNIGDCARHGFPGAA